MKRTRVFPPLAMVSAVIAVAGSSLLPVASADQMSNGLSIDCTQEGEVHATCVISGCARVNGDHVIDALHIRVNGGEQEELAFKCINAGTTARTGFDLKDVKNNTVYKVSVQGCRKNTGPFEHDDCGPWSDYFFTPNETPAAAPAPASPESKPTKCTGHGIAPPGKTCAEAFPQPATGSPAPVKVAPTDAVHLTFDRSPLTWTANVTNSADLAGNCTYKATNPLLPGVNKSFNIAPKGTASFSVLAPPALSTYHVVVSCHGTFDGKDVEFGHEEQDVSL
ncbi:MAG: hypothetical protein H6523_00710 [Mycolicibacterium sp.]|jgi:hypothetical protein|nr:hypothetical protein [Mycolicibacterium sp.]